MACFFVKHFSATNDAISALVTHSTSFLGVARPMVPGVQTLGAMDKLFRTGS
jgi:hypothetical protein